MGEGKEAVFQLRCAGQEGFQELEGEAFGGQDGEDGKQGDLFPRQLAQVVHGGNDVLRVGAAQLAFVRLVAGAHLGGLGELKQAFAAQVGKQAVQGIAGAKAVEHRQVFGEQLEHEGVGAHGPAYFLHGLRLPGLQLGVVLPEQLQGLRLGQALDAVGLRALELLDAGGEQQVEVAAAPQVQVVGLQVLELVGVVDHQQAGPAKVEKGRKQDLELLRYLPIRLKEQSQRLLEVEKCIRDALLAQHPGHVLVLVLVAVVIARRQGRLAYAALPVDQHQQVVARKQVIVHGLQVVLPAYEDFGEEGWRRQRVRDRRPRHLLAESGILSLLLDLIHKLDQSLPYLILRHGRVFMPHRAQPHLLPYSRPAPRLLYGLIEQRTVVEEGAELPQRLIQPVMGDELTDVGQEGLNNSHMVNIVLSFQFSVLSQLKTEN